MTHLSPAIVAGGMLYTSGQLGYDETGVVCGDIVAQTERCLTRLETVLADHGSTLAGIVKTTVWLRHGADFAAFDAVYRRIMGSIKPARTTLVAGFPRAEVLIEIEAIAIVAA